ncbi:MAG TPA: ABC transporter substrate-binding protein [Candidatus Limnocylindria bacterium]|nr:ABC transporter substrate-binding protein [Candidatus Limnocylindria bacterium]
MSPFRPLVPVFALALALVACSAPSPTGSRPPNGATGEPLREITLLLGFRPDVQFAPFYVAQQDGYYADAGLEVTIEHQQAPDVQRLVASGEAEFGVADATDVMIARTSGIPIRYASTLYQSFPVAIIGAAADAPSAPSDLDGRTIGTPGRFGSSWHALLALLDAGGLTQDDVTIREYPQFNQADGLASGDVELITGFRNNEPLRLHAQGMDVGIMTVDEFAPLPGPGVIVGDDLVEADPDLVRAFVEATAAAQAAVIDDPDLGFAAAEEAVPTISEDPEVARAVLDATIELWRGDGFDDGRVDRELWDTGYATMERLGFIDGSVPVEEMLVDLSGG